MITNIVILTATITPPENVFNLVVIDPKSRLDDYAKALEFYIEHLKKGILSSIVFCENSSSSLDTLRELCNRYGVADRVEFLSFFGLDYPPTYDRGYGEFKLLEYAMTHSETIKNLPESAIIWKITGRYIVRNIQRIIKTKPQEADLYCHCRTIPQRWMELYVMAWNKKAFLEILQGVYQSFAVEKTDKITAEGIFFDKLAKNRFSSQVIRRFKSVPEIEGVRGFDGKRYESMKIKIFLRKVINTIFPWLWI